MKYNFPTLGLKEVTSRDRRNARKLRLCPTCWGSGQDGNEWKSNPAWLGGNFKAAFTTSAAPNT